MNVIVRKQENAMTFLAKLEKQPKLLILLAGFTLIVIIGCIDFLTGYEFAFRSSMCCRLPL